MGNGYYFDIGMGRFLLFCMKWVAPDFIYLLNASDILVLQLDKSHQRDPAQEERPQKFWALGAVAQHTTLLHIFLCSLLGNVLLLPRCIVVDLTNPRVSSGC